MRDEPLRAGIQRPNHGLCVELRTGHDGQCMRVANFIVVGFVRWSEEVLCSRAIGGHHG
jgi:hypothetical protein